MSRNKGDTLVRSPPSVMGVEIYGSPHMGGSNGGWIESQSALITKISPTSNNNHNASKITEESSRKHSRSKDRRTMNILSEVSRLHK